MFFTVVAQSDDIDAEGALAEILAQCREKLGERVPKAGLLFCTIDLEHEQVLDGILDAWPGLELIGCTTAGEMSSALGYREDSVALVLFGSDSIEFASGIGRDVSKVFRPPAAPQSNPPRRSPICRPRSASPYPKA